jgi:membrane protease YdiL (CAAX protease family)
MRGDPMPLDAIVDWGLIGVGLLASISVWAVLLQRKLLRRPWVPFQRRRPVPWNALAVVGIVALYLLSGPMTATLIQAFHPKSTAETEPPTAMLPAPAPDDAPRKRAAGAAEPGRGNAAEEAVAPPPKKSNEVNEHLLVVVLGARPELWVVALCAISAIVVAPIWEETLFRLVFQGWLERVEARIARECRIPAILRGVGPVLLSALLFAVGHARAPLTNVPVPRLILALAVHASVSAVLAITTLLLLRGGTGANAIDLGWDRRRFWNDVGLGAVAFAAIMVPLYVIQAVLKYLLQLNDLSQIAPDPVPIFFFALVLGYLYFRTHRIVAPIAMHMALNATTMGLFLLG